MSNTLQSQNKQEKAWQLAEWIRECRESGQSVPEWCRSHNVCIQTYYRWQRRLVEIGNAKQEVRFAEITPEQPVCVGSVAVRVRIGGVEADICNGADAAAVETVLWLLKSC